MSLPQRSIPSRSFLLYLILLSVPGCGGCCICGGGCNSWPFGSPTTKKSEPLDPLAKYRVQQHELNNRVRQLEDQCQVLDKVLADLDKNRLELGSELRKTGVKSSVDLKDNRLAQAVAKHLQQVRQEIEGYKKKREECKIALLDGNALIAKLDRTIQVRQAGITEEDLTEVAVAISHLDERLKSDNKPAPTSLEIEKVVDEELKAPVAPGS
jgi:hypothetical protein